MPYVNGEWQPDTKPTGPYGATWNGMVWDPASRGYVAPTQPATQGATIAAANEAGPQAAANTKILQNQAQTSAPGYVSPLENIASLAALRQLGAPTHTDTPYTDPNRLVTSATPNGPAWTPDTSGPSLLNPSGGNTPAPEPSRAGRAAPAAASLAALDDPGLLARENQAEFRRQVDASLAREAEQRRDAEAVAAEQARHTEIVRSNVAGERQSTAALAEQARQADLAQGSRAATLAETTREATANEGLAAARFGQQVKDRSSALSALDAVGSSSPARAPIDTGGGGAPAIPAYDRRPADLAYTAARERVGEETAGALKSLRDVMTRRGIGGTGIEGNATRGVVLGGLKNLAAGDFGQAGEESARAYDWAKTAAPLTENARQFNVTAGLTANQQAAQIQQQKIDALLRIYGSQY